MPGRCTIVSLFFSLLLTASHFVFADARVTVELDRARTKYQSEIEELNKSITEVFEKKIETARKSGDKAAIDALTADLSLFVNDGFALTSSIPASFRRKLETSRAKLERALESAAKRYVRSGADESASLVERELKEFRQRPLIADTRRNLVGVWNVRIDTYNADLTFSADGTMYHGGSKIDGKWSIDLDAGFVIINYSNGAVEKFKLPLSGTRAVYIPTSNIETPITKKP